MISLRCFTSAQRTGYRMRRTNGFTLVELMVALALGLLLLTALIALVVSTVTNRSELDKSSRQIENGRYALQLIGDDIESAGFIGTTGVHSWPRRAPAACPANVADLGYISGATPQLPLAVQILPAATSCPSGGYVKSGSRMLLVTRASSVPISAASAEADEVYLQVSNFGNDSADFPSLVPFMAARGDANFELRDKSGNPSPLRRAIQRLYFLSDCNECGKDQIPTLKVAEYIKGNMAITPLVDGIEDMRFDFGVDTDGNGSPDCYVANPASPDPLHINAAACPPPTPAYDWADAEKNWGNVMAVRIHVLARTTEASGGWKDDRTYDLGLSAAAGPFNDSYKRHAYSTVVRLNNPSGLRELP